MSLVERLNKIENFAMEKKRKEEEARLELLRRQTNAQKVVTENIDLITELCIIADKISELGLMDKKFEDDFFTDMWSHQLGFYNLNRNRNGILNYGDYISMEHITPMNKTKHTIAKLGGGYCHYDILIMNGNLYLLGCEALSTFEKSFLKELYSLRDRLYELVDNLN